MIEIKLERCTVFLTPQEIHAMLQAHPEIFKAGVKRGKGILRHRKAWSR